MLILKFLSENRTEKVGCLAEHGLSIYIETEEMTLIFDLGQSDIFIQNAKVVNADLRKVEAVIVSHAHFDHTNGIPKFCQINTQAPIYLQKDAFGRRYQLKDGKPIGEDIGILWTKGELEKINGRLRLVGAPVYITENIAVSGTMNQNTDFVRAAIIDEILKYELDFIMPLHCTGMEAIWMLKARLGARCIIAGAGDTVDLSNRSAQIC